MFNPFYCLFEYSAHDNYTLQINPASGVNPEHLNYFKFIGRCLGLGIFHRRFLDAYFIVSFYKMILKKKVTLSDLESVDAELHRGLTWMLENDITGVIDETFTTTEERFGELVTIDLKEGGSEIEVTEENKKDYVDCVVEYRISKRVKEQFDAFMSGFSELIPQDLINVFDERELELLIGGMSEIDVYVSIDTWIARPRLNIHFTVMTGPSSRTTVAMRSTTRSSNGSGSVFAAGLRSARVVCSNLPRARRASRSMASRIYRALTVHGASRLRKLGIRTSCPSLTRVSTVSTCRRTRTTRAWSRS